MMQIGVEITQAHPVKQGVSPNFKNSKFQISQKFKNSKESKKWVREKERRDIKLPAHIVLPDKVRNPSQMIFSKLNDVTEGEKYTHVFNNTHATGEHNINGRRPILSERCPIVGLNRNSNNPIVEAHLAKIFDILAASLSRSFPRSVVLELKLNKDNDHHSYIQSKRVMIFYPIIIQIL